METYPYEQLGPTRFQRLAQAVISREFENTQAMPLRGPDGGRDAIALRSHEGQSWRDSVIWQVKYREPQPVGNPTSDDLFEWIVRALMRELPKLQQLKIRGTSQYILVTNVPASGHPASGLRDRVHDWMAQNIPVASSVWWRDDLDARLVNAWDVVFKFSLFTGPDAVRACLEKLYGQAGRDGGEAASRAFLKYCAVEYGQGASMGFKQAGLGEARLFNMFVDAPVLPRNDAPMRLWHAFLDDFVPQGGPLGESQRYVAGTEGAAHRFLSGEILRYSRVFVVEGAPGQGKSTLAQYMCQVNRAKLLCDSESLTAVPQTIRALPARAPVRIECRRFAAELGPESDLSIEEYVAAQVSRGSGGSNFSVDDLAEILSRTPCLFVLDGLDEVPSFRVRERVVRAIQEFVTRLDVQCQDQLILITSRPSLFVRADENLRLPYPTLVLQDLDRRLVDSYVSLWMTERRLTDEQENDLRKVTQASLDRPHVLDLARNAMQLSILMYLVWTKGWSLPEKRTALYESYMSTFLDREAEKTPEVREHRELLLELHGVVGWMLHARAQVSQDETGIAGDISREELIDTARDYLRSEERDPSLAERLFAGVQRVYVLVGRNEGRYEFEVQPLREFFAARHLYKTAQHSIGDDAPGARPDRLEAIVRDPYWLNVARFFCGFYEKGELADLSRRIVDLMNDSTYALLTYPRQLAHSLLTDQVMSQSVRDTKELAAASLDDRGFRSFLESREPRPLRRRDSPPAAGAPRLLGDATDSLMTRAFELMSSGLPDDLAYKTAALLREISTRDDRVNWFKTTAPALSSDPGWWKRAVILDALAWVDEADVEEALRFAPQGDLTTVRLFEAGHFNFLSRDAALLVRAKEVALNWGVGNFSRYEATPCSLLWAYVRGLGPLPQPADSSAVSRNCAFPWGEVDEFVRRMEPAPRRFYGPNGAQEIMLLERLFGDAWVVWCAAISVVGRLDRRDVKSLANSDSVLGAVCAASLALPQATTLPRGLVDSLKSTVLARRLGALACLSIWGGGAVVSEGLSEASGWWGDVPDYQAAAAFELIDRTQVRKFSRSEDVDVLLRASVEWNTLPLLVAGRLRKGRPQLLKAAYGLATPAGHVGLSSALMVAIRLRNLQTKGSLDESTLDEVRNLYMAARQWSTEQVGEVPQGALLRWARRLTPQVRERVLDRPLEFPREMFMAADEAHANSIMDRVSPIAEIALVNKWFRDEGAIAARAFSVPRLPMLRR